LKKLLFVFHPEFPYEDNPSVFQRGRIQKHRPKYMKNR
jgi:hypothetical protein